MPCVGPTRAEGGELGRINQVRKVAGMTGAVRQDRQHGSEQQGQDAEYLGRMLAKATQPHQRQKNPRTQLRRGQDYRLNPWPV